MNFFQIPKFQNRKWFDFMIFNTLKLRFVEMYRFRSIWWDSICSNLVVLWIYKLFEMNAIHKTDCTQHWWQRTRSLRRFRKTSAHSAMWTMWAMIYGLRSFNISIYIRFSVANERVITFVVWPPIIPPVLPISSTRFVPRIDRICFDITNDSMVSMTHFIGSVTRPKCI